MFAALLKRLVPFFTALALALFVSSFFINLAAPRFNFRRERMMRQCQEMQNLRTENQRLRMELLRQQNENFESVPTVRTETRLGEVDVIAPPAVKKSK